MVCGLDLPLCLGPRNAYDGDRRPSPPQSLHTYGHAAGDCFHITAMRSSVRWITSWQLSFSVIFRAMGSQVALSGRVIARTCSVC
jgi:hypothetical protein